MTTRGWRIAALLTLGACSADPGPAPSHDPPGAIHLPAFTFRTMDRAVIKVEVNGEPLSTTPCLWSITEAVAFDKELQLPKDDPKAGAKFVGSTELDGKPPSKVDVYVLAKPELLGKYPTLRKDE